MVVHSMQSFFDGDGSRRRSSQLCADWMRAQIRWRSGAKLEPPGRTLTSEQSLRTDLCILQDAAPRTYVMNVSDVGFDYLWRVCRYRGGHCHRGGMADDKGNVSRGPRTQETANACCSAHIPPCSRR